MKMKTMKLAITLCLILGIACLLQIRSSYAAGEGSVPQQAFTFEEPKPDTEVTSPAPRSAKGTHHLDKDAHVWMFLRDIFGGYYLQNPPVELLENGQWEEGNIRIGKGIKYLIAVQVDVTGHQSVLQWVNVNRWGKITAEEVKSLSGYKELARVSVKTPNP